jgi:hypothetical protein
MRVTFNAASSFSCEWLDVEKNYIVFLNKALNVKIGVSRRKPGLLDMEFRSFLVSSSLFAL